MKHPPLLLLLFICTTALAQTFNTAPYSMVIPMPGKIYIVGKGGNPQTGDFQSAKWGYVDDAGNILLPVEYEQIGNFVSDYAVVRKNGKYGMINRHFQLIIPCDYAAIGGVSEKGLIWVNQGGKMNVDIPDKVEGGLFGVYNTQGKNIVPVKYKAIGTFNDTRSHYGNPFETFTAIPQAFRDMEKVAGTFDVHDYSYIDSRMGVPMEMKWDEHIVTSTTGTYLQDGITDFNGKIILQPGRFDAIYAPTEGMIPVSRHSGGTLQANYYKIASDGLMFTNWVPVDCITPFVNGVAIMAVHDRNTFINTSGAKLGTPYNIILPSESGYYVASQGDLYGLVTSNGEVLIPCEYAALFPMTEGRMLVCKDKGGLFGYMDIQGHMVIEPEFERGTGFTNGLAMVRQNGQWGMIDLEGNKIVRCAYFSILPPTDEVPTYLWVRKDKGGKLYCIDTRVDEPAFPYTFTHASNFNEHYHGVAFVASSSGKYGCIDTVGNYIIPDVMNDAIQAINNYGAMLKDGKKRWNETDLWRWKVKVRLLTKLYPIGSTIPEEDWDY